MATFIDGRSDDILTNNEYNLNNDEDIGVDLDDLDQSDNEIFENENYKFRFKTLQPDASFDWKNIGPDSPRRKYAEIYESIDNEEMKILALEERRKKLEIDMQKLQEEIEYEKRMYREAIDLEFEKNRPKTPQNQYENAVNPLDLDKDEIKHHIQECQKSLELSKSQSLDMNHEQDPDIERFKTNLEDYKKGLNSIVKDQSSKNKRKAAEEVFEKHFLQVEKKCDQQISYLANIQKSIEKDFSTDFCSKKEISND